MTPQQVSRDRQRFRHRLHGIALEPDKSIYDIFVELYADGIKIHRLPSRHKGQLLHWDDLYLPCDASEGSSLVLRITEVHPFKPWDRVGQVEYVVPRAINQDTVFLECDNKMFKVRVRFLDGEAANKAYLEALGKVQSMERQPGLLEKAGRVGHAFKALLNLGSIMSDLDPTGGAKVAFSVCTKAWEHLEQQEKQNADLDQLVKGLARMIPSTESVKDLADDHLRETVVEMLNLIEDVSLFLLSSRPRGSFERAWRSAIGLDVQEQVQVYIARFNDLRKEFDTRVNVQALRAAETERMNMKLRELKPARFASYNPTQQCIAGTRVGIISELVDWALKVDAGQSLAWVHGPAGFGKSSIATSVCLQLDGKCTLASSFFCKRDSPELRDPHQVLTTIAYGLSLQWEPYRDATIAAITKDPGLHSRHLQPLYDLLLCKPLQKLTGGNHPTRTLAVVIDAIDECGDAATRKQLLTCLQNLPQIGPWLRIIVTSRPNLDIQEFFTEVETGWFTSYNILHYDASADIRTFVQDELGGMTRLQNWPSDAIDRISHRASGLFIWARTACKFIMNGFDRLERLELVLADSRMADIDSLYTTAIKVSILDSAGDNMNYLRQCLGAVVVTATRTPLSASNLALLLHGQISQNVLERVLLCLSSVLYVDEKLNDAIRIFHPSFMDFVTDRSRSGDLCIDLTEQNTIVAERCLSIMAESLRFNIGELETSDLFNSDVQNLESRVLVTIRPHLSYSCLYWSSHVVDAQVLILGEGLRRFLFGKELIYWIEALSLLGKLSTAPASLLGLMACLTSNVVQDCRAVANDAYRFVLSFYDAISKSTPHLYISALAFAPSSSGIAQRMRRLFPKLLVVTQGAEQEWTPCLRSVWVSSDVTCAVFSPDSRRIVSGSADGKVRVWDAETGDAELEPMAGHSDGVSSVAFSPNGRWIVSGSNDKTVRLWDSETGKMHIGPLRYHTDLVFSVAFSPDSRRVASSSRDKTIHVWDLVTSKSILKLAGHSSGVRSVTFSPDGCRIISGSDGRTMRIWNLQTGELKLDPLHGHSSHVRSVAFSPDGNRVVSSSDDRTVRIWDATTGNTLFESLRGHSNRVQSVTFSPDSRLIASGSADRTVRIWNANTGDAVFQPLDNHSDSVRAVSFSPDGRRVVSGSKDKTMRIWDVVFGRGDFETRQSHAASKGHAGFVKSVAFSPSGRCVASGSDDRTVRVWEAETGIMILGPLEGHTGTIQSIAFSSDSRWILSSSEDKTARIWDAESGNPVLEPLQGHSGVVLSAVFSPDSHLIASGSQDRTIRIWDAETGKETLGPLVGHSDQVTSVAFSPGGHQLVSGSWDKTVRIWDAYTGQALLEPLLGHSHWVLSVAFSPDGCRIVSGSHDTTLRIWDAGTGNVALDPLQGHGWSVRSVTFSPDGRWIASGSDDGTVRVWNTDTGETVLNPLLGHAGGVASIAFSPDGRRVVSGSWDKTIRIWSVESHISENSHISRFQLGTLHSNLPTGASSSDSATTGTNIQAPPVHTPSDMLLVAGAQLARHLSKNLPGWVTSIEGKPIVWLPPELREVDDSLVSITPTRIRRQPLISFANFVHGSSWASILDRQV